MTLRAFVAERRLLRHGAHSAFAASDRYFCLLGAQQQIRRLRCCCRSMGHMNGLTDDARPLHRPCSAYCAGNVNNHLTAVCSLPKIVMQIIQYKTNTTQVCVEPRLSALNMSSCYPHLLLSAGACSCSTASAARLQLLISSNTTGSR